MSIRIIFVTFFFFWNQNLTQKIHKEKSEYGLTEEEAASIYTEKQNINNNCNYLFSPDLARSHYAKSLNP